MRWTSIGAPTSPAFATSPLSSSRSVAASAAVAAPSSGPYPRAPAPGAVLRRAPLDLPRLSAAVPMGVMQCSRDAPRRSSSRRPRAPPSSAARGRRAAAQRDGAFAIEEVPRRAHGDRACAPLRVLHCALRLPRSPARGRRCSARRPGFGTITPAARRTATPPGRGGYGGFGGAAAAADLRGARGRRATPSERSSRRRWRGGDDAVFRGGSSTGTPSTYLRSTMMQLARRRRCSRSKTSLPRSRAPSGTSPELRSASVGVPREEARPRKVPADSDHGSASVASGESDAPAWRSPTPSSERASSPLGRRRSSAIGSLRAPRRGGVDAREFDVARVRRGAAADHLSSRG